MRDKKFKDFKREGHHGGEHHKGKDRAQHRGAKTFRRGRALAFLEMMNLKRLTIKQQLDKPEFQSIKQILVGELKAIDMVINEFIQLFEIRESEVTEVPTNKDKETEIFLTPSEESLDNDKKGIELDEEN